MIEPTRLIVIRHGQTAWNVDTRIQGHLDIPLDATGRWQAARLGEALAHEPVDAIYASDLSRAWDTAQAIAGPLKLSVQPDILLRERGFGTFEGRTFADIERTTPEQALRWRQRDPEFAPEGGENLVRFRQRIIDAAEATAARHQGQLVVLVAHGGVMDILYRAATRQDLQAPRSWQLGNAAINRILWTPQGFSLIGWNDTAHLSTAPRDEVSG